MILGRLCCRIVFRFKNVSFAAWNGHNSQLQYCLPFLYQIPPPFFELNIHQWKVKTHERPFCKTIPPETFSTFFNGRIMQNTAHWISNDQKDAKHACCKVPQQQHVSQHSQSHAFYWLAESHANRKRNTLQLTGCVTLMLLDTSHSKAQCQEQLLFWQPGQASLTAHWLFHAILLNHVGQGEGISELPELE